MSKQKVYKQLPIRYFWLVFPAIYLLLVSDFLNQIYTLNVLFPSSSDKQNFIYFASDIFDVFWLIIAAIPNTLFAGAYFLKTCSVFTGKGKNLASRLLPIIIITTVVVWFGFISPSTTVFSSHCNVWSYNLPPCTFKTYKIFEFISIGTISFEAVTTIAYICYYVRAEQKNFSTLDTLPTYALVASITMFLYWIMLNLSNMKISNNTVGDPYIFPQYYGELGSVTTLAVTISAYLFWKVFSKVPLDERPKLATIVGSILLPGVAIILQIIQIL